MAAAYTTLVAYIVLAGAQIIFARKVHLKETGEKSVYNDKAVLFYGDINDHGCVIRFSIVSLYWVKIYNYLHWNDCRNKNSISGFEKNTGKF